MSMIVIAALAVLLALVFVLTSKKPTPPETKPETYEVRSIQPVAQPLRRVASWEVETEEDIEVISRRYWEERRREREDQALGRLGSLVPATPGKTK